MVTTRLLAFRAAAAFLLLTSFAACSKKEVEYEPLRTRISWQANREETEGTIVTQVVAPEALQLEVEAQAAKIQLRIPRRQGTFSIFGCSTCNTRNPEARIAYLQAGASEFFLCGGTITVTRATKTVTTGTFDCGGSTNDGIGVGITHGSFNINH